MLGSGHFVLPPLAACFFEADVCSCLGSYMYRTLKCLRM